MGGVLEPGSQYDNASTKIDLISILMWLRIHVTGFEQPPSIIMNQSLRLTSHKVKPSSNN